MCKNVKEVKSLEEAIKVVENYLDKSINFKKDDGYYEGEIYINYNDEGISDSTIKEVFNSDKPMDSLYEIVSEGEADASFWEKDALSKELKTLFTKENWNEYSSYIEDYIMDNVHFVYPDSYIYGQSVTTNIVIGTEEEADYEFTLNTVEEGELLDGSIKWLIEQQGYSLGEFYDLINNPDSSVNSKFLNSIVQELENCTTSIGKLTAFVKMTIREILNIQASIDENELKSIVIPKECNIGLIDNWNGAGSVLEIVLEKDLVIPKEHLYSIAPDVAIGYSVDSIYGMSESFWKTLDIKVNKSL